MKAEIIRLLKSCDGYLSGQELCEKLNVSRTAVWKVINQLREEGYEIEAVRNKGYRLVESADVMTAAELESCMGDQQLGLPVKYCDKIDSTNNQVRRLAEEGAEEGLLVVAECQEAGKGRRGRVWKSPGRKRYLDELPVKAPGGTGARIHADPGSRHGSGLRNPGYHRHGD